MTENFNQNYENGRFCERDGFCVSGCCDAGTSCNIDKLDEDKTGSKKCVGLMKGESCNKHSQCDLGLGCIKSNEWPFAGTCETLRKDDTCEVDEDC